MQEPSLFLTEAICMILKNLFNLSEPHFFSMYELGIMVRTFTGFLCGVNERCMQRCHAWFLEYRKHHIKRPALYKYPLHSIFSRSIDLEVDELPYAVDIPNPDLHYGKNNMTSVQLRLFYQIKF